MTGISAYFVFAGILALSAAPMCLTGPRNSRHNRRSRRLPTEMHHLFLPLKTRTLFEEGKLKKIADYLGLSQTDADQLKKAGKKSSMVRKITIENCQL